MNTNNEFLKIFTGVTGMILAKWDWTLATTIMGFFLAAVSTMWYLYSIYCKWMDRHKNKE